MKKKIKLLSYYDKYINEDDYADCFYGITEWEEIEESEIQKIKDVVNKSRCTDKPLILIIQEDKETLKTVCEKVKEIYKKEERAKQIRIEEDKKRQETLLKKKAEREKAKLLKLIKANPEILKDVQAYNTSS